MALIRPIPASGLNYEIVGQIHSQATTPETITCSKDYKVLVLSYKTTNGTLTVTNNNSLTPASSTMNTFTEIYENVPSGTVFTATQTQTYWHEVSAVGFY